MKPKVTKFSENAGAQLRRDIVHDYGCRLEYDKIRDANGDICGMENFRAVMRAKGVDRDILLEVDVDNEPEDKRLDGLSLSAFQGLAWGDPPPVQPFTERVSYAVFKNGRALRLLNYRTPSVEDAAERTARELAFNRLQDTKAPAAGQPTENKQAAIREAQAEKGRRHGTFFNENSKIMEHDKRLIKERFERLRKEQRYKPWGAAAEIARLLNQDAIKKIEDRSIPTRGVYPTAKKEAVMRFLDLKK